MSLEHVCHISLLGSFFDLYLLTFWSGYIILWQSIFHSSLSSCKPSCWNMCQLLPSLGLSTLFLDFLMIIYSLFLCLVLSKESCCSYHYILHLTTFSLSTYTIRSCVMCLFHILSLLILFLILYVLDLWDEVFSFLFISFKNGRGEPSICK